MADPGGTGRIAMVLSAVFVPMAFFGGTTGAIVSPSSLLPLLRRWCCQYGSDDPGSGLCATPTQPLKKGEHHGQKGFFAWLTRCLTATPNATKKGCEKCPP
ncbi:hypothetical protein ACLK1S_15360 [Escherichia coli]